MPDRVQGPYSAAVRRFLLGESRGRFQRCRDRAVFYRVPAGEGERLDSLAVPQYALEWASSTASAPERVHALVELALNGWSWRSFLELKVSVSAIRSR
jgi:hypothetical protein